MDMVVDMYSITQGYGFCTDGYIQVFFRVEDFVKLHPSEPQPILGESVQVTLSFQGDNTRATSLKRLKSPQPITGTVTSFDSNKGWGFVSNALGTYFLHKSDFVNSFVPIIGNTVSFYSGRKKDKLRACYVTEGSIF